MAADGTAIVGQSPDADAAPGSTLTVVLPNYNHARLIPRALEALFAQDPPPDEIIVVDDGSADDSLNVVAAFAKDHPSLRVLANPTNMGAIATLARGLAAARGRYVYFAAADDWVVPGFFATAIAMLEAHPRAGLFCGEARLVDGGSGRTLGVRPPVRPVGIAGRLGEAAAHHGRDLAHTRECRLDARLCGGRCPPAAPAHQVILGPRHDLDHGLV